MDSASSEKELCNKFCNSTAYLAVDLYSKLKKKSGNLFFSPLSISVALSMLLRGAKDATAEEIAHVLRLNDVHLSTDEILHACNQLLTVLDTREDPCIISTSNALLIQKDFKFLPDCLADLQDLLHASAREVDFANNGTTIVQEVNQWVKDKTKNMITKILECVSPDMAFILLNAIYFKGTWTYPFNPDATRPQTFYSRGCKDLAKEVPMMCIRKKLNFFRNKKYRALELPYHGDNISMILLLPTAFYFKRWKRKNALQDMEKEIKSDTFLPSLMKKFQDMNDVDVTIPKVKIEYSTSLQSILEDLGMKHAFKEGANFHGLADCNQLYLSSLIHKAVVDINEEGTVAAAVTEGVVMCCSLRITKVEKFRADHPFLFMIYDKVLNVILFMGRIQEL